MENDKTNAVIKVGSDIAQHTKSILHIEDIKSFCKSENVTKFLPMIITIVIFFVIYKVIKKLLARYAEKKFGKHHTKIASKILSYTYYLSMLVLVLEVCGINLSAVWGAAGIAGVAIGFAAQTTVSNMISGIFVLGEKVVRIGDFVSISGVSGTIDSITLLSVKIHTVDNQMVRIPNSTIINGMLTNFNTFDKRRFVFDIPISYGSDMEHVMETIKKVPGLCPSVLSDPEPVAFYDGFGEAINLKLAVWFNSSDLIKVKNEIYPAIVKMCNENNVVIPFNRIDVKLIEN